MNEQHNHPQIPVVMIPAIDRYGDVNGLEAPRGVMPWGFSLSQANDLACGSKSYLRHVQGLKPTTSVGFALGFGSCWHDILESFGLNQIENGKEARSNADLAWKSLGMVELDTEIALRALNTP